ncbi:MAG: biotin/lipoyl-binding protein [Labilithrix sp.]|nr:biotin/lipoyl-binding protein [Labilithrix sp.]MCW5816379.1 biotin/lipoyl-binding protein [Labilithrix sp.]
MRYYVTLDPAAKEPVLVDVNELPTGQIEVRLGDRPVAVDVVPLEGALSVRVGGRVVDLTVEGSPPEIGAVASGHRSYVRVESERQRAAALAKKAGGGASEKVVKSPMPGRVVRILVQRDAEVAAGQTLCVIEAMKMENEVKAKAACKVVDVHATEGATVENGAKLFTLG